MHSGMSKEEVEVMRTLTKLGIGMLAVIVLLACVWMYHTHSMYEKTYRSEYRYVIAHE